MWYNTNTQKRLLKFNRKGAVTMNDEEIKKLLDSLNRYDLLTLRAEILERLRTPTSDEDQQEATSEEA